MMRRTGSFVAMVVAVGSAVLAHPTARADEPRAGTEPWYQGVPAEVRERAQALFSQGVARHEQLLRVDARELYEQALELWDNPDVHWNLALVLDDLGEYMRAHEQFEAALRWSAGLGELRLREIRVRIGVLETRRLARIEGISDEPGAEITLDGVPWFRGPGSRSVLVVPGAHYVATRKPGYFPVTRSVTVPVGQRARVEVPMDVDRLVMARWWSKGKLTALIATGLGVMTSGLVLELIARDHRDFAARTLADTCTVSCLPRPSPIYDRAVTEDRVAVPVLAAGSIATAVGLALWWLNQPYRTAARRLPPIEVSPILSSAHAGVFARLRF